MIKSDHWYPRTFNVRIREVFVFVNNFVNALLCGVQSAETGGGGISIISRTTSNMAAEVDNSVKDLLAYKKRNAPSYMK